MNNASAGITLAALVAGWPLYELVAGGDLDLTTAVVRGGVVAVGCAIGIGWVVRIASDYEQEIRRDKSRQLNALFSDMEDAMTTGALQDEEAEQPGQPGQPQAPDEAAESPGAASAGPAEATRE